MSIDLPPLNGFHVFESAARHLSFTKAAKELFVTQAAVSQQIKQLESHLGFKLFHRLTRQLALTDDGKTLFDEVQTLLSSLAQVINELKTEDASGALGVSTLPSFAIKWLIPRLTDFNEQHPEIILHVHTSNHPIDFKAENIDMAIRYGRGNYPGLATIFMMRDEIFPVCSPKLLEGDKPLKTTDDLKDHLILYDVAQDLLTDDDRDWKCWFTEAGATEIGNIQRMAFHGAHMALEAAITGKGIALGRTSIARDDLSVGRLVRPFDLMMQTENAYYIVSPKETAEKPKVKIFRDWLLKQANLQE